MAYLNKVMLIGNVGKNVEYKVTTSGKKKGSFSLATSRKFTDASGEKRDQTDWHNVVAWGKTADLLETLHVGKGSQLYVDGSITYRSWDQDGQKKYMTEILLNSFQILRSKDNADKVTAENHPEEPPAAADDSEDLPF